MLCNDWSVCLHFCIARYYIRNLGRNIQNPQATVTNARWSGETKKIQDSNIMAQWIVDVVVTNGNIYDLTLNRPSLMGYFADITPDEYYSYGNVASISVKGGNAVTTLICP